MNLLSKIVRFIAGERSMNYLIKYGLRVGKNFCYGKGCLIDPSHPYFITIGDNVTLSTRVTILSHDASTYKIIGYTRLKRVTICDNVFIGANSIILPGVKIGKNSIIGAGSVVTKDVPDNVVACGNPARIVESIEEFAKKLDVDKKKTFGLDYKISRKISKKKIEELKSIDETVYIK